MERQGKAQRPYVTFLLYKSDQCLISPHGRMIESTIKVMRIKEMISTVEPRLSGLVGTSVNSPDNRESG